jgi:hypothetical protein
LDGYTAHQANDCECRVDVTPPGLVGRRSFPPDERHENAHKILSEFRLVR